MIVEEQNTLQDTDIPFYDNDDDIIEDTDNDIEIIEENTKPVDETNTIYDKQPIIDPIDETTEVIEVEEPSVEIISDLEGDNNIIQDTNLESIITPISASLNTSSSDSTATINVDTTNLPIGEHTILVKYEGNTEQDTSVGTAIINVVNEAVTNTLITLQGFNLTDYVANTIDYIILLTENDGVTPVANKTVYLYCSESETPIELTTNSEGKATGKYTFTQENNVTFYAQFNTVDTYIESQSNPITCNIQRHTPIIEFTAPRYVSEITNTYKIKITDEHGNIISGLPCYVVVDGVDTYNHVTGTDGTVTGQFTFNKGEYNLYVYTIENDTYHASQSSTKTISVNQNNVSLELYPYKSIIDTTDDLKLIPVLTNLEDNTSIIGQTVKLYAENKNTGEITFLQTINTKEYPEVPTETDYIAVPFINKNGEYNIYATYDGKPKTTNTDGTITEYIYTPVTSPNYSISTRKISTLEIEETEQSTTELLEYQVTLNAGYTTNTLTPLSNEPIQFYLTGITNIGYSREATVITDENGQVLIQLSEIPAGKYNIHARYGGNTSVSACMSTSLEISVGQETTIQLTVNKTSISLGRPLECKITLTNSENTGIYNRTVNLTVGDILITGITDLNGEFTTTVDMTVEGQFNCSAIFNGDNKYMKSISNTIQVIVIDTNATPDWYNLDNWNNITTPITNNTITMSGGKLAYFNQYPISKLKNKRIIYTLYKNAIDGRMFFGIYNPTNNKHAGYASENMGFGNGGKTTVINEEAGYIGTNVLWATCGVETTISITFDSNNMYLSYVLDGQTNPTTQTIPLGNIDLSQYYLAVYDNQGRGMYIKDLNLLSPYDWYNNTYWSGTTEIIDNTITTDEAGAICTQYPISTFLNKQIQFKLKSTNQDYFIGISNTDYEICGYTVQDNTPVLINQANNTTIEVPPAKIGVENTYTIHYTNNTLTITYTGDEEQTVTKSITTESIDPETYYLAFHATANNEIYIKNITIEE